MKNTFVSLLVIALALVFGSSLVSASESSHNNDDANGKNRLGQIVGMVYNDQNQNGSLDRQGRGKTTTGEQGLNETEVRVYSADPAHPWWFVASLSSGAQSGFPVNQNDSGTFSFSGLPAGDYYVCPNLGQMDTETEPAVVGGNVVANQQYNIDSLHEGPRCYKVNTKDGQRLTFGLYWIPKE